MSSPRPSRAVSVMMIPTSSREERRDPFRRRAVDRPSTSAGDEVGGVSRRTASTRRSASSARTASRAPAARRDSAPRWRAFITPAASMPRSTALTRAMPSSRGVMVTWRARAARSARSRDASGSSRCTVRASSARSLRSPIPCSESGSATISRSITAQAAAFVWARALANAAAFGSVIRPSRSSSSAPGKLRHQPSRGGEGERAGRRGAPTSQRDLMCSAPTLLGGGDVALLVVLADPALGDDLPGRLDRSEGGTQVIEAREHGERLLRGTRRGVRERVAHRSGLREGVQGRCDDLGEHQSRFGTARDRREPPCGLLQDVGADARGPARRFSRHGSRLRGSVPGRRCTHALSVCLFEIHR